MGDKAVSTQYDEQQLRRFTRAVLTDLQALELMIANGLFEENVRRIGAEQEMFLVDSSMHPAPLATRVIEAANEPRLTTEIGLFNLEANMTPLDFEGHCLRQMEIEMREVIGKVRETAHLFGGGVVLAGILPTIQQSDLTEANMTPQPRYFEINRNVTALCGDARVVHIKGLDEMQLRINDTFSEFCNTSFQVHLQIGMSEFTRYYNWAQAVSAPILAAAANSPLLMGQRLWSETRIALFQHATDTRSLVHQARNQPTRVNFGDNWIKNSILEMFHEDALRFRVLLTQEVEENSLETLKRGEIPRLASWRLHNGTVWRWNRACYGIAENGKPGLRIEARYLPSGPTIADEMANAAFYLGLMTALPEEFCDVTKLMRFDDAKNNFFSAARYGLKSQLVWFDGKSINARRLILEELLPRARYGLSLAGIAASDIERYLGILEERVQAGKTGADWMINSLAGMDDRAKKNVRMRSLTAAMKTHQEREEPLHTWDLAQIPGSSDWIDNYRTVEQFMSTDLFTVCPEDVIDLAANLMHWKHVRHVPVEDDKGKLVGVVTHRDLLELFAESSGVYTGELVIRDIMKCNPICVKPETPTLEALRLMREKNIGCLPVIKDEKLVGLLTAHDFLTVSTKLLEERLNEIQTPAVTSLLSAQFAA